MPTYIVTAPDGNEYEITAPEGASEADVLAYAKANYGKAAQQAEAAPAQPTARQETKDRLRGPVSALLGPVGALANIGASFYAPFESEAQQAARRAQIEAEVRQMGGDPESLPYKGTGLATEVFGGVKALQGLGALARAVPALRAAAPAIESGGLVGRTATERAAAGALTGGLTAGMVDPSAESAGFGAGLGAVTPVAFRTVAPRLAGTYGFLEDLYRRQLPEVRAGNILRQAAGNNLAAIRASAETAPTNMLASQAVAEPGTPAFMALLRIAEENDPNLASNLRNALNVREAQRLQHLADLEALAGGATQTEARAAREAMRRDLRATTGPMRETELAAANATARFGRPLEAEAERAGAAASQMVEDVRRFTAAGERAAGRAAGVDVMAQPETFPRQSYWERLSGRAETVAGEAAESSLIYGAARRDAEQRRASLAAHGLSELDVGPLLDNIRSTVNRPGIRLNQMKTEALNNVANLIEEGIERGGGVLDARDLYSIRKDAINSVIQRLYPNANAKTQQRHASELLGQLRPLIDDAIETAGGTGWRNYLKAFEEGMTAENRRKLGARIKELYELDPERARKVIEGNDPNTVEKAFGRGSYDVIALMGDDYPVLRKIADDIAREGRIAEKTAAGGKVATNILQEGSISARIPNLFSPKITITNQLLGELELVVNKKTMEALSRASRSGQDLARVLDTLPFIERNRVIQYLLANPQFGAAVPAAVGAGVGNYMAPTNVNALASE